MAEDTNKTAAAPAAEGAEGAPAEGAVDQAAAKKKKLMMMASAGLAVVGVIVAVGVFFVFGGKKEEAADHEPAAEISKLAVYDVPEFTINLLADEQAGGPRFLKIQLAVELVNEADTKNMEQLLPRLQDDWGGFLRQLRPTDLQGSAALQRLKEGLLRRAVQTLEPVEVRAVYIREMLVQ